MTIHRRHHNYNQCLPPLCSPFLTPSRFPPLLLRPRAAPTSHPTYSHRAQVAHAVVGMKPQIRFDGDTACQRRCIRHKQTVFPPELILVNRAPTLLERRGERLWLRLLVRPNASTTAIVGVRW